MSLELGVVHPSVRLCLGASSLKRVAKRSHEEDGGYMRIPHDSNPQICSTVFHPCWSGVRKLSQVEIVYAGLRIAECLQMSLLFSVGALYEVSLNLKGSVHSAVRLFSY